MKEYPSYQRHLKEPEGDKYFFPEGVVIWPQNTGRGVLQNGVYALRIEEKSKD